MTTNVVVATALKRSVLVGLLCVLLTAAGESWCSKEVIECKMCGLTLFSVYLCPATGILWCVRWCASFRTVPKAPAMFPLFGTTCVILFGDFLRRQQLLNLHLELKCGATCTCYTNGRHCLIVWKSSALFLLRAWSLEERLILPFWRDTCDTGDGVKFYSNSDKGLAMFPLERNAIVALFSDALQPSVIAKSRWHWWPLLCDICLALWLFLLTILLGSRHDQSCITAFCKYAGAV